MQATFYVSHEGEQLGPFSLEEIAIQVKNSTLLPIDYVFVEDKDDWVLVCEYQPINDLLNNNEFMSESEKSELDLGDKIINDDHESLKPIELFEDSVLNEIKEEPEGLELFEEQKQDEFSSSFDELREDSEDKIFSMPTQSPEGFFKNENGDNEIEEKVDDLESTIDLFDESSSFVDGEVFSENDIVSINNGVAILNFTHKIAGKIKLSFFSQNNPELKLQKPVELVVKPGHVEKIFCQLPPKAEVGQKIALKFKAVDSFGNTDTSYSQNLDLLIQGKSSEHHKVTFHSGIAHKDIQYTVAETVQISLKGEKPGIELPKENMSFTPGPATQFIVESPAGLTAGEHTEIKVKALDQFGNVATHYSGEINLKLEASRQAS